VKKLRYFIVIHFLDNELARKILGPIYLVIANLTCKFITWRFPSVQVWCRNSIITDDIIPGVSDIDLTLYTQKVLPRNLELQIKDLHKLIKHIFPIMGEWNFYYEVDLPILKKYFNPIELSRDPKLADLVGQNRQATESETTVYLLRQWQSDKHHLRDIPKLRAKKWKRIEKRTNVHFDNISLVSIKSEITKRLNLDFSSSEQQICLFPHEWIGKNWNSPSFLMDVMRLESFSSNLHEICRDQINWEVCGILCQLPMIDNPEDMNPHFYHLSKIMKKVAPEDVADELGKFGYMINRRYVQL